MPLVQFGGLASGLDSKAIVDALMNAERAPLRRLQAQQADLKARQSAYTRLTNLLNDLTTKAKAFTVNSAGASRTATSSSTAILATAAPGALPATYQVRVEQLATATRATSLAGVGTAISGANSGEMLADLPFAGTIAAGTIGAVVNGTVVRVTVGDPTETSLDDLLADLASAIESQIQQTPGDEDATVTASIVGNRIRFSVDGATGSHAISFGVGGDTSNALTIFGLRGVSGTLSDSSTVSSTTALGVVRASAALDGAGLSGLTSTTTGKIRVNGVEISYDSTTDSLSTVLGRINASSAGVVASLDRANDKIVITSKAAGATPLDLADVSGNLLGSLALGPGTTSAQELGKGSRVWVDDRLITADTNRVSTAIPNVTLELRATTASAETVSVGLDTETAKKALADFVKSFNSLVDQLATDTGGTLGGTRGVLARDSAWRTMGVDLRGLILSSSGELTGALRSLGAIGVSTGATGATTGPGGRLMFDEVKFAKALADDPDAVARLLGSAQGVIAPVVARLTNLTKIDGPLKAATESIATQQRRLTAQETDLQERLDARRAALERKYAALEAQLSGYNSTLGQLSAQVQANNRSTR